MPTTAPLGGQHCNVAATAADVEHAQTRCEAGLTQEALRDRLQDGRLKHQAAKLGWGMAEDVGDIGHCSFRQGVFCPLSSSGILPIGIGIGFA
jgi:hypothetical protein